MNQTISRFNSLNPWYMKLALEQAEKAFSIGEVPVGCIIVDKNNKVISSSYNLKESTHDPCGHAEIIAIRKAAKALGNWRLKDCRMYVTLSLAQCVWVLLSILELVILFLVPMI